MSDQSTNRFVDSLRLFVDIARLRRGPEDLPTDRSLLTTTVLAFGLLNVGLALVLPAPAGQQQSQLQVVVLVLIDIAMTLAMLYLLLQMAHKPERFRQTAAAMFGFHIVLMPVLLAATWLALRYGADKSWELLVAVLRLGVVVWVLAAAARILRSATEWPFVACVALVITMELLMLSVIALLFPQTLAVIKQG